MLLPSLSAKSCLNHSRRRSDAAHNLPEFQPFCPADRTNGAVRHTDSSHFPLNRGYCIFLLHPPHPASQHQAPHRQLPSVKARQGQYGKASADIIGDDKGFVALSVAHALQRALCAVGCGKNTFCGFCLSVFFLQKLLENAEGNRRLRSRAGFGNDVDGKVPVSQNCQNIIQIGRADVVPYEINIGVSFFRSL